MQPRAGEAGLPATPAATCARSCCAIGEDSPPLDAMSALCEFENGASGLLATVRATPLYWRVHAFGDGRLGRGARRKPR